ncbi:CAP domain-containing protein [Kibdelosporangium aridum]|uniref:Cysteine-rich secretory protein family protein n=1 Tax=Kibdelosporangium aridum TaxID=2030 RepID=A0A1Y5WX17_KIBAR|nr:CAP domain-containing protein [Kibdelosporangium aridum]SMC51056.1 Cysteine-rich secretory protein family protein [Kibdelosporangium aridum]
MTASSLSAAEKQLVLDMHNQYRSEVGLPGLVWDDGLASGAQDWADRIANGDMVHSDTPYGENISRADTLQWAIEGMYEERELYHGETAYGNKPWGHYTQMVWKDTKKIGVGGYNRTDGTTLYVFRYDPPGNYGGQAAPFSNQATVGPVGVASATFDDTEQAKALEQKGKRLTKLVLRWGDVVDSITAVYGDEALGEHGGRGIPPETGTISEVPIARHDPIVEVAGFHGKWFVGHYVQQMSFKTKLGKTYGPFGSRNHADTSAAFSLKIPEWHRIRALFGSVTPANNNASKVLGQIGFALAPASALFPKPTVGLGILEGDNQTAKKPPGSGVVFPRLLRVRVSEANLVPVAGVTVTFAAAGAGARAALDGGRPAQSVQVKTDQDGTASALGVADALGTIQVTATVDTGPEPRTVTFSLTAVN